jgi:hypothetical protein
LDFGEQKVSSFELRASSFELRAISFKLREKEVLGSERRRITRKKIQEPRDNDQTLNKKQAAAAFNNTAV